MSQLNNIFPYTMVAAADLSAKQYLFAKITADYTVNVATLHSDSIPGVIYDIPYAAAGAQVGLHMIGTTMIMAGGAISAGAKIKPSATGKAAVAATGEGYHAIALQAATADGDLIECLLVKGVAP
jgi:hypothetical protein